MCLAIGNWYLMKTGGKMRQESELATVHRNGMAKCGYSLTKCSTTLVSRMGNNFAWLNFHTVTPGNVLYASVFNVEFPPSMQFI